MKLSLLIIVSCFITNYTSAQGILEAKQATIELKNLQADDQPTTVAYTLKNKGNQPVIISRIVSLNPNLKTEWNKEPLAPGKSVELQVTFPSLRFPSPFNYKIILYSNAQNNRLELNLKGNIVDNPAKPTLLYKYDMNGVKFKKTNINFEKIFTWQVVSDTIDFFNTCEETVTLDIQYKPSHIDVRFIPVEKIEPGQKGILIVTYDAPKKNDYGYNYESLILNINNSRNYANRLTVTANIIEDFSQLSKKELENAPVISLDRKEIHFGEIKQGEKVNCDFTLTNTGRSTLFIRKTKASCGCTAVTLGKKAIEPGKSTTIRATFDSSGKSGRQYKSITVITNDPPKPEIILTINGNIKN